MTIIECTLVNTFLTKFVYKITEINTVWLFTEIIFLGWFAAVANMYDTVEHFKHKAKIFETFFRDYLNGRDDNMNLLNKCVLNFNQYNINITIKFSILIHYNPIIFFCVLHKLFFSALKIFYQIFLKFQCYQLF